MRVRLCDVVIEDASAGAGNSLPRPVSIERDQRKLVRCSTSRVERLIALVVTVIIVICHERGDRATCSRAPLLRASYELAAGQGVECSWHT